MRPFTQQVIFKNHDAVNKTRTQLLKIVDDICIENDLSYFAIKDLLTGAVHYSDFIPSGLDAKAEIGLLREDFDKLVTILYEKREELEFDIIDRYKSGAKTLRLCISKEVVIEQEALSVKDVATIEICAFDFVPTSVAERRMFQNKVSKLRSAYEKSANLLPPITQVPMNLRKVFLFFKDSVVYGRKSPKKLYSKFMKTTKKYSDTGYVSCLTQEKSVTLKTSELFPLNRVKFNDIEINLPNDYSKWTVQINDDLMKQTRTIQKIDLVLLKEFDTICRKIGVKYFICGGTLLGHKRHGGFIPWDDDIDVGMLRADYDKFLKEANKYLGEDFFLQTRKSDRKIPYLFSKIRLNGTEYVTNYNELRDFHKGICLDLFPFDYVPNSLNERKRFVEKVLFWSNVHFETVNHQPEKPKYENRSKTFYEWWARFSSEVKRKAIRLIPLKLTQHLYIKKATKYNKKAEKLGLTTVASYIPTYTYGKASDLYDCVDIDFEGITVMSLKDPDKFLTMQYGDYSSLPLLHKRVGHDLIRWSVSDEIADKYNIYED